MMIETETTHESVLKGPGERLKKRRESIGWTAADVASRLHLRITLIEALEEDNYRHISKLVFARGYLRAYAKLLHLPGNELMESFNQSILPTFKPENSPVHLKVNTKAPQKEYSLILWPIVGSIILLFILIGLWSLFPQKTDHLSSASIPASVEKSHILPLASEQQ